MPLMAISANERNVTSTILLQSHPLDVSHERFRESEVLRCMFERVVATRIAAGLVGGEAFSTDASLIRADVDQTKRAPGDEAVDWPKPAETSRAIAEYLAAPDEAHAAEGGDDGDGDRKSPKQVSLTDPGAVWVARKKMSAFFAYDADYLIDNKLASSSMPRARAPTAVRRSPSPRRWSRALPNATP